MITRYFSFKRWGLPLVLAGLLVALIVVPVLSAQVTLLSDGFEKPITFDDWDANGITNWKANPSVFHSGLRSARASNNSEGFLTSDNLDASDAVSIGVDFWFNKLATTDTGFALYYYNGTDYDLIAELDGLGADSTWTHYTQTITDPKYFKSDFRIRFDATLAGSQLAYVDDVLITKDTGETLTVSKTGNGTVTSTPAGIDCGLDCSKKFATNAVVTLSAVADPGWAFTGWSGDCTGSGPCQVTMSAARSVTAEFKPKYALSVSKTGNGSGTVTGDPAGIDCGEICSADYDSDTVVTLSAVADTGSTFTGWSGSGCSGTGTCQVTMTEARSVTAEFTANKYTLSVSKTGSGSGTVSSDVAGIDCGLDCSEDYDYNTVVTLSAVADTGSTFTGWSGSGCSGTGTCVVTMTEARSAAAEFTLNKYTLSVSRTGTGTGTVSSTPPGIDCGSDCSEDYDYNTVVTLSAVADPGSTFAGWSGACTGAGDCVVTTTEARSVTAEFTLNKYTLSVSKAGTGTGTVTSSPAGIDCGLDCSEDYDYNTAVTLSAVAGPGSNFAGWSGACTGTGDCVVTMTEARSVTAEFTGITHTLYLPLVYR